MGTCCARSLGIPPYFLEEAQEAWCFAQHIPPPLTGKMCVPCECGQVFMGLLPCVCKANIVLASQGAGGWLDFGHLGHHESGAKIKYLDQKQLRGGKGLFQLI